MQQWGNKQIQRNAEISRLYLTCAFGPESSDKYALPANADNTFTKAGLLTYSTFSRPSHPCEGSGKQVAKRFFCGAYSIG
jgi:hypothetical protein